MVRRSKRAEPSVHSAEELFQLMHSKLHHSLKSHSRPCLTEHTFCGDSHLLFFLEKPRAAVVSALSTPRIVYTAQGCDPLGVSHHLQRLSVSRTEVPPFASLSLLLSAAKGGCFHIPLPQNKAGALLVLGGTHCASQFASSISGTGTSQTTVTPSYQQANPPKKRSG